MTDPQPAPGDNSHRKALILPASLFAVLTLIVIGLFVADAFRPKNQGMPELAWTPGASLAPAGQASAPSRPPGSGTEAGDQRLAWAAWQEGPHASTYALEKGPNTYCARCHAPQNWDPQAKIDPPPNCVSCKFPNEPKVRLAASNPLVDRSSWKSIPCATCHRMDAAGNALPGIAWWDQAAGQYADVAGPTALCEKCHTDTATLRHRRDLSQSAHRDLQCTTCHDPHSAAASCQDCHQEALGLVATPDKHGAGNSGQSCGSGECHARATAIAGASYHHDTLHPNVTCGACHDGSGLEAAPDETGRWLTWRTTSVSGMETRAAYQSHELRREVDCARCHYEGNPWNLAAGVKGP